jgi:hypothetical protein
MAHPRVADGEDGLKIWREAANIFVMQSRAAHKGWSYSLEAGHGANKYSPYRNNVVTKCHKGPRTWTDSLDKRPKLRELNMKLGTWNVRILYRSGSIIRVAKEISMDLRETGWSGMDWIDLAQNRDQRRVLVNAVLDHLVSLNI